MDVLTEADQAALRHTVNAIGRTGARSIEIGHLDDEPPHRWYATAQFRGAKMSCDNQDDPIAAVIGLYAILAAGGQCVTCGRPVALEHGSARLVDGARMRQGVFQTRTADRPRHTYCVRKLQPDGWSPEHA